VHVTMFTRINVAIGTLVFSLLPFAFVADRIEDRQMTVDSWTSVFFGVVALQLLLFLAQKRCSSKEMPFWKGIIIVGAAMRTGWAYLDLAIVILVIPLVMLTSVCLLFFSNAGFRFHRLVYVFYQHRMEQ